MDSCFLDCYKGCNPSCQHVKTPLEIQGQGDCQGCFDVDDDEKFWLSLDDKFRGKNKSESQEGHCDCYKKINRKDCQIKQKKISTNYNDPWSSGYADWDVVSWKDKHKHKLHEHSTTCDRFNYLKLSETVAELEGKVNFLFQFFKDCGQKLLAKSEDEKYTKENLNSDELQLSNLNKRLKAAEEGIVRLTLILENLFKRFDREKNLFFDAKSQCLNHDEMKISDVIDVLKNRNDFLFSFVKDYLETKSAEDGHPRQRSSDFKQQLNEPYLDNENVHNNLIRKEMLESLKNLKADVVEPNHQRKNFKNEKKYENSFKYGTTLEVISEQAELALNDENETSEEENFNESPRNLRGKFSKVRKTQENLKFCDATSKLLAQEALLKSTLDKVNFEVLSGSIDEQYMLADISSDDNIAEENTRKNFRDKSKESVRTDPNSSKHTQNLSKQSTTSNKKIDNVQDAKTKLTRKTLNKNNFTLSSAKIKQSRCSTPEVNSNPKKNTKEKEQRPLTAPNVPNKTNRTNRTQSPSKSLTDKVKNKNVEINNVKNKNKNLLSQKPFVRTS